MGKPWDAAKEVGVSEEKALLYVKQTILGAATVMAKTDTPLDISRHRMVSLQTSIGE